MEQSTPKSNGSTESLHDKATRRWVGLRLLERMVLQRDEQSILDANRKTVDWWHRLNMGGDGAEAMPAGEDMGDMIAGDQKIIHHHYPQPKSKFGTLAKLALGGALLASGVGAGFAVPILWSALKPKPPVVQQGDSDSDTATDIGFWDK